MSSRRPSHLLAAALVLAAVASGCSSSDDEPGSAPSSAPTDVVKAIGHALDGRARVVRRADPDAFAGLVGGGAQFRARQETWFDNLTQLPIARLRYRLRSSRRSATASCR
jgi:hypothetical protein